MTIKIRELTSNQQHLVDLTNTELSEVKGGFALAVTRVQGITLAAQASRIVFGQSSGNPSVISKLQRLGIRPGVIAIGEGLASTVGGGKYTLGVTSAKLDG
jgi:hypothetical protein